MKSFPFICILAGLAGFAAAQGQNAPVAQGSQPPPPGPPGTTTFDAVYINAPKPISSVTSAPAPWITFGGPPTPYGSGGYPNLQNALQDLYDAAQNLDQANAAGKGDYLNRARNGVKLAMDDVMLAIDFADGKPTPPVSTLSDLPPSVGNASSGLQVVLTTNLTTSSPFMDNALAALDKARLDLKITSAGNKGIFLPRAIADVAFAIDNAKAGFNMANGAPPSQPKTGAVPTAASPTPGSPLSPSATPTNPTMKLSGGDIMRMGLLALIVLAIAVEQFMRAKR